MKDYLKLFNDHPGKTCFILKDDEIIFSSYERGVKPILDFYHEFGSTKKGLTVVDKVMGKGAIILAKLINTKYIITPIISVDALDLAKYYNMDIYYESKVEYIINSDKDGRCPIESSVLGIANEQDGYKIIIQTLKDLKNKM